MSRSPISTGHLYGPAESYDYDSDIFDASGVLAPSAVPVDVRLAQVSVSGDVLWGGAYFISIEVAAPVLTKTVSPTSIASGGVATYTWVIDNTGAGATAHTGSLSFVDALPSGIVIASPPGTTNDCGGTVVAAAGGTSVELTSGSTGVGSTCTITVDITNAPGQTNTSCASNPAAFTNGNANITSSNILVPSISDACLVVSGSITSLSVTKVASVDPVTAGVAFDFVITVTDTLDGVAAEDVTVTDILDAALLFQSISASGAGGSTDSVGPEYGCSWSIIPDGESRTCTITVVP